MLRKLIHGWVQFSIRRPWFVILAATVVAALFGFEAQQNFTIRSDLADLLPDTKTSVANHRWVYQFAGAPEVIEPILAVREPLADRVEVVGGEYHGRSQDIGSFQEIEPGTLSIDLRKALLPEDFTPQRLEIQFIRDRNRLDIAKLSGEASQIGARLTLKLDRGQATNLEAFKLQIRGGDPNRDGVFAMDVAQEGLATLAKNLEALESVVYVLHRMELEYFEENILLFADTDDLKQLKCCIRWKQKESLRSELGLGGPPGGEKAETANEVEDEEDDEDDPFASDTGKEEDPDCAGRTLDDDSCGLDSESSGSARKTMPEYFVSTRGYLALFVKPRTPSNELDANKRTQTEVRETILRTIEENHESFGWAFDPGSLQLGGGFVARHDAVRRIEADLFHSVGLTLALLFLILIIYYRRGRALVIVLLPLVYGVTGALGAAFLAVGYLNLITTFIFAVLLGLGIDFGIHVLNRYIEERSGGASLEDALTETLATTGVATTMGAITTAASFGALMLTAFPGFSQFGLIAGMGVPLCLLNVFVLVPPIIFLWERWRPIEWPVHVVDRDSPGVARLRRIFGPGLAGAVLLSAVLIGAFSFLALDKVDFEYDMRNVRSLNPEMDEVRKNKSGTTEGLTLSPAIALGESREHASRIFETLRARMKSDPNFNSVERVIALDSLIPDDQDSKLEIVAQIRTLLRKKRDFVDDAESRDKIEKLYQHTDIKRLSTSSIPESLLRFFRGKPRPILADVDPTRPESVLPGLVRWLSQADRRSLGHFIYIFPGKDMYDVRNCIDFASQMDTIKVEGAPLLMSASQFVYGDLLTVIQEDGVIAVLLAFYAVFLFVLLDFAFVFRTRHRFALMLLGSVAPLIFFLMTFGNLFPSEDKVEVFKGTALLYTSLWLVLDRRTLAHSCIVLVPLLFSFLMLLAALPILGWRINFFNVVVFPTILGIGVDSGIHIYHRFLEEGEHKLPSIIRYTGSSIALATLTTGIGFGAMIGAAHLGLQSIAKLAMLGLSVTLINAVVLFPCLLKFLAIRGWLPNSNLNPNPMP